VDEGRAEKRSFRRSPTDRSGSGSGSGISPRGRNSPVQAGFVGARECPSTSRASAGTPVPGFQQKGRRRERVPGGDLADRSVPPHPHHGGRQGATARPSPFRPGYSWVNQKRVQQDDGDDRHGVPRGRPAARRRPAAPGRTAPIVEANWREGVRPGRRGGACGELVGAARGERRDAASAPVSPAPVGPKLPNDVRDLLAVPVAHLSPIHRGPRCDSAYDKTHTSGSRQNGLSVPVTVPHKHWNAGKEKNQKERHRMNGIRNEFSTTVVFFF